MRSLATIKILVSEPVVSSGLLISTVVPSAATATQISQFESTLPRKLSVSHRQLLLTWNGLDLDVVRFFAAPPAVDGITSIPDAQVLVPSKHPRWIAVASDPAGFLYAEDEQGAVWSIDHDGGSEAQVASCLDEFIAEYVFGSRADEFGGASWRNELVACGILSIT